MRIAMVLDKKFPPDPRVEREATSLIQQGHELFLISISKDETMPENGFHEGITVIRRSINNFTYRSSALAYSFSYYHKKIKKILEPIFAQIKPEAIHIHDMVVAEAVFQMEITTPIVLDLHENRPIIMREYGGFKKWPNRLLMSYRSWEEAQINLAKKADRVIVVTEEAKNELIADLQSEKIVVVPNTVDLNQYKIDQAKRKIVSEEFNLIYFGDTGLRRGTDTLLMAMPQIIEKVPFAKLNIIGKSGEDGKLKELIKTMELNDHVSLHGWQDVNYFKEIAEISHVGISPLKRNGHHDTTHANKIFQYMASGLALVASDSTAQARLIKELDSGLIFDAESDSELASKVIELFEHPELLERLAKNGVSAMQNEWDWSIKSRSIVELYSQLSLMS